MNNVRKVHAGLLIGLGGLAAAPASAQLNQLFSEDWESFQLFSNIEEGVFTGPTQNVPNAFFGDANDDMLGGTAFDGEWAVNGWRQEFNLAGIGTAEWEGWSIANKDFWMTADDQNRSLFANGLAEGAIAVADPDEWDDYDPTGLDPDTVGFFQSTLTSPAFSIAGVEPNTIVVRFDSSWRDEDSQKARMSVAYDGGAFEEVFLWTSDPDDPNFKDDAENETVTVSIDNPAGAGTMQIQFEMLDATNDWWWAIDNIAVAGEGGDPTDPPGDFALDVALFNETTRPTFTWGVSLNALEYDVIIANDEAFGDVVVQTTTTNLLYTPGPGVLQSGLYFVKIIARNDLGSAEQTASMGIDNPCPADFNGDTSLNFFDVSIFLQKFGGGTCP